MAICGGCGEEKVCIWGCSTCVSDGIRGMTICSDCITMHDKFSPNHKAVPIVEYEAFCKAGRPILCDLHKKRIVEYYCSTCNEFGCRECSHFHKSQTCKMCHLAEALDSVKSHLANSLDEMNILISSIESEVSDMVGLSEERLMDMQVLHAQIDKKADESIQFLQQQTHNVEMNRKSCHEQLEALIGKRVREIQDYVLTLETRMKLASDITESAVLPEHETNSMKLIEAGVKINRSIDRVLNNVDCPGRQSIMQQSLLMLEDHQTTVTFNCPSVSELEWGTAARRDFAQEARGVIRTSRATDIELLVCAAGRNNNNTTKKHEFMTIVADDNSGSVRVFDSTSGLRQRVIGADLDEVSGLATFKHPTVPLLFVSSSLNKVVVFNALTGELLRTIGEAGSAPGKLSKPCGLLVRASREAHQPALLYVCDTGNHRVQVFDIESGGSVKTIGTGKGDGKTQFNRPSYCAIFEGNDTVKASMLFVSDRANHRVQVFGTNTGAFIKSIGQGGVAGAEAGQLAHPMGVAVCACDTSSDPLLLVAEHHNHRIQLFNVITGLSLQTYCYYGSQLGQLRNPVGLRVISVNNKEIMVFIADCGNERVQNFIIAMA